MILLSPAGDGRDDPDLGMIGNATGKPADVSNVLVADKNVDVLAHLTLLGRNAVAQSRMEVPQKVQRIRQGGGLLLDFDFGSASCKFPQGARDVEGQRHGYFLPPRDLLADEDFARDPAVAEVGADTEL